MTSTSTAPTVPIDAQPQDPWGSAFASLSEEDRSTLSGVNSNILEDLKAIQQATEDKKRICEEKSWKIYTKKDGGKVTIRHLLEKMSFWVTESIKVVDTFISFDASGHAALPWATIKFVITGGISTIEKFSEMIEHVESLAGLLARYTAIEKLYLSEVCESREQLREAIVELYASILSYLAAAKKYFGGGTIKQIGRSVAELFSHRYEELWAKVSEVQVDKWVAVVAAEMQSSRAKDSLDQHTELKDILRKLDQPIMDIAADFSSIKDSLQEEERKAVYKWLSKIKYREHHTTFSKGLLKDSGIWLLQSREYVRWGQSSSSSTFWLHGKPGAGKTRLTSQIIEQMKVNTKPSSCSIAYYYCDRTSPEPGRNKCDKILGTLLRQLASVDVDQPLRPAVVAAYKKYKDEASEDSSEPQQLSTEDCIALAKDLTRDYQATIAIDAVDECDDDEQYELLQALDSIVANSDGLVKVFVSSRETTFLRDIIRHSAIIDLDASGNAADIGRFVETEVDRLSHDKRLLRGRLIKDGRLRKKTIKKLKSGAQGMFRWVVLSLETLIAINHPKDFEESLGKLPPKLSELYDIIFKQIEKAGSHERDVVTKLLKWLLCAQSVLSVDELIYAVSEPAKSEATQAVNPDFDQISSSSGETSAEFEESSDEEQSTSNEESFGDHTDTGLMLQSADIVLFCRSLVSHDVAQNTLRFAHQSVREYLITKEGYSLFQAHSLALERSLWQMKRLEIDMEEIKNRIRPRVSPPFAEYAILFWPVHAKEVLQDRARVPEILYEQALNFLVTGDDLDAPYGKWSLLADALWNHQHLTKDLLLSSFGKIPAPLFVVCSFGLLAVMGDTTFQESVSDWNCRNNGLQTGLTVAATLGASEIVQHLLNTGVVKVNAQDEWQRTALSYAAENGHEQVVKQLLAVKEVDADLDDLWERTPAVYAARNGHGAVLTQLIDVRKVKLYRADEDGLWALSIAAFAGHESVVRQLLSLPDIMVDFGNSHVDTALSCAAQGGHESIVKLLLATEKVDVNAYSRGTTILCHTIRERHEQVLKLLFATGKLDVTLKNKNGSTALTYAVEARNETLVKQLLCAENLDIDAGDNHGTTALLKAVMRKSGPIVKLLLDTGKVDVNSQGWRGFTPLTWARKYKYDDLVVQLEQYAALHHQIEDKDGSESVKEVVFTANKHG